MSTLMELWAANCCPAAAPGTPSLDGRPAIHHVLLPIAVGVSRMHVKVGWC